MKTTSYFLAVGLTVSLGFCALAGETLTSPTLSILKSVPLAELPGKAAAIVATANAKVQVQTTVDVVKAAVGLNPAAAPAIVGSIAASTPSVAAIAAATAASVLPQQAALLAQTAAAAAPKMAGQIVEAVCKVAPKSYKAIAEAVAEVAPDAAREILAGIAAALPNLKEAITNALAIYKTSVPSVSLVLAQTASTSLEATLASGSPIAVAPRISQDPPYIPRSGSPVNLTPGGNGTPVTGPRNYSAPVPPVGPPAPGS